MTLDAKVLERAGIHVSPEEFERLVLAAVQEVAPPRGPHPEAQLTEDQVAALRRGGIDPLSAPPDALGPAGPAARGAALYAAILATSLSVPEAARRLGVDESRVRQRIHARTLYAVKPGATWRIPVFQFSGDRLVPGIDRVLPHLPPELSPLEVLRWFQYPSGNLVTDDGVAHAPLDWMMAGRPLEPVIEDAVDTGYGV